MEKSAAAVGAADKYAVYLHVIEARKLKSPKTNGTVSAMVQAELFDRTNRNYRRLTTDKVPKASDALFDKQVGWTELALTQRDIDTGRITFSVYDRGLLTNGLIGQASVDLAYIYNAKKTHELYKVWVALMTDDGVAEPQGYLQFTACLCKGTEMPPVHDEAEEEEGGDDDDLQSKLLTVNVKQIINLLVFKAFQSQWLTIVTRFGRPAPYVQVRFGSVPPSKTRVPTGFPRRRTIPKVDFLEELRMPISLPALSNTIEVSIYDRYRGLFRDALVASTFFSFDEVYSAYEEETGSRGIGPLRVFLYKDEPLEDVNIEYVGNLLLQMEIRDETDGTPMVALSRAVHMPSLDGMELKRFVLRFDAIRGVNFPARTLASIAVEVEIAHEKRASRSLKPRNTECSWCQRLPDITIDLPTKYPKHFPKIVVKVYSKSPLSKKLLGYIAYEYDHANKQLKSNTGEIVPLKFGNLPQWRALTPRLTSMALDDDEVPGFLMYKLDFGLEEDMPRGAQPPIEIPRVRRFQLVANVHMARNLPVASERGTSNPFVMIRCAKESQVTAWRKDTLFPTWFETITLNQLDLPTIVQQAPPLMVTVYHRDTPRSKPVVLGRFTYKLQMASRVERAPTWFQLQHDATGSTEGELLASFSLIPSESALPPRMMSIWPAFRDCLLEVQLVNLFDVQGPRSPGKLRYVVFNCGSTQPEYQGWSALSNAVVKEDPVTSWPKHGTTVRLPVKVPLSDFATMTPYVTAHVYETPDQHEKTRRDPSFDQFLGFTAVNLVNHVPWAGTRPPLNNAPEDADSIEGLEEALGQVLDDENAVNLKPSERGEHVIPIDVQELNMRQEQPGLSFFMEPPTVEGLGKGSRTMPEPAATSVEGDDDGTNKNEANDVLDRPRLQHSFERIDEFDTMFDLFELKRGRTRNLGRRAKRGQPRNYTHSGFIKCNFRLLPEDSVEKAPELIRFDQIFKPVRMFVRAIVTDAFIPPSSGKPVSTFLRMYLSGASGQAYDDSDQEKREPSVQQTFNAIEDFEVTFPGDDNVLTLEVWAHGRFAPELVGRVRIDLGARFLSTRWKEFLPKKPFERLTLFSETSDAPRGYIIGALEFMTPEAHEASEKPVIRAPKPAKFEIRMIVWKVRGVTLLQKPLFGDTPVADVRVSARYPSCTFPDKVTQMTDVHHDSTGTAEFNWRIVFEATLPDTKTRGRIWLQVWNAHLVRPNDVICEGVISLDSWLNKAARNRKKRSLPRQWLKLFHPNHGETPRGEVELSVEVMTREDADQLRAGYGRSAPNQNPKLETPKRPQRDRNLLGRFFKGLKNALLRRMLGPCIRKARLCGIICGVVVGVIILLAILVPSLQAAGV